MNKVWGVIKSHKLVFAVAGVIVLAGGTASAIALTGGNEPAKQQAVSTFKENKKEALSNTPEPVQEVATPVESPKPSQQAASATPDTVDPPAPVCAADAEHDEAVANENRQYATIIDGVKKAYPDGDPQQRTKLKDQEKIHSQHMLRIDDDYMKKKAELGC